MPKVAACISSLGFFTVNEVHSSATLRLFGQLYRLTSLIVGTPHPILKAIKLKSVS